MVSAADNVDIPAATEHGVWVTVTPGQNSQAVAEHVFALALALARKVVAGRHRHPGWRLVDRQGRPRRQRTARQNPGLYGLGSIGTRVATIADGFGMNIIVTDPYLTAEQVAQAGGRKVDLDELLTTADIISLHIPLTPATRHVINADAITTMRPGTLLINTARGGLIDEQALIDALRSGHLGGAGVDVLAAENIDMKDPLPHNQLPLDEVDTLIVTPHVAGQTNESLRNVGAAALTCIRQALAGHTPNHALNTIAEPSVA